VGYLCANFGLPGPLCSRLRPGPLDVLQQSAYRAQHSTEAAVLKIVSDILWAADSGKVTLLGLFDMSAAFDTVDHSILIDRLNTSFGIRGAVLSWIQSYITGRTQVVWVGDDRSSISSVLCGVPQGSVLGPVLFLLYTADVLNIIQRHGLRLVGHSYADDSSIYLHLDPARLLCVVPIYQLSPRVLMTLVPGCSPTVSR